MCGRSSSSPDAVNNYVALLLTRLWPCFAQSIDSLILSATQLSRPWTTRHRAKGPLRSAELHMQTAAGVRPDR